MNIDCPNVECQGDVYPDPPPKLGHPTDLTCESCDQAFTVLIEKDEEGYVSLTYEVEVP